MGFQYEALAWLCGGLGFFATLGLAAVWNDKASKYPFVSLIILFRVDASQLVPIGLLNSILLFS